MGTLGKQWVWVVWMFVGNMSNKRFPLGNNEVTVALDGWSGTPVDVIPHSFRPLGNLLTSLLLTRSQHFFTTPFAMCHWSKKCWTVGCDSLIHFATPRWRSETNIGIDKPATVIKKSKHAWAPASSMALLLPVWFAYNRIFKLFYLISLKKNLVI